MNIQANAIHVAQFAGTRGKDDVEEGRQAQQRLTMNWMLRAGLLIQVWRTIDERPARLWTGEGQVRPLVA